MASTISINFATVEEVFAGTPDPLDPLKTISQAPQKKSVSARVLAEALGGGRVGGGYVQRTGGLASQMTGFLYLTGRMPQEDLHAVPKRYVDDHSYTRRYHFVCRQNPDPSLPNPPGYLVAGTRVVSGFDLNTNPFYFFERTDTSRDAITQYVDVYRDGVLQRYGANDDYEILSTQTFFGGTTAIRFFEPFKEGTTVQVNIGNVGALPLTFGVSRLSAGFGTFTTSYSGDVSFTVTPSSFAATSDQVSLSTEPYRYVSPHTLSAHPLVPRAIGLFVKDDPGRSPGDFPDDLFGSELGFFRPIRSFKLTGIQNDPLRSTGAPPEIRRFRVFIQEGTLTTKLYNAVVSVNMDDLDPDNSVNTAVITTSRELTSFDFFVYDIFGSAPPDISEISVMVY